MGATLYKNVLKIGTITANYNQEKYLSECIDGILNQTVKPDYAVIIDDCSTDNSVGVIKDKLGIVLKDSWSTVKNGIEFYIFKNDKNSGPAATRNVGVKFLMDKVHTVCIADSDDILYPTKLEKSAEVFLRFPHTGLVYSDYDTFNMQTGQKYREYKEIFHSKRLFEECIVSNNSMIATNVFHKIGLYDETLFGPEDYDMWLRISDVAAVYHIPEALYQYRLHGNNITITTPSERFAQHVMRVKQKAMERRNAKRSA